MVPAVVCLFLYYLSEFGVMRLSARRASLRSRLVGACKFMPLMSFLASVPAELFEESCGVHAVAFFEAGEFAIHDGEKEFDDGSAVVGLFHDDVMDRFGEVGV